MSTEGLVLDTNPRPKYPPIPENQYQAVLAEVVDHGKIQERFDDEPKHKLMLIFQLSALRDDGKRHELKTFNITASLHEKSTLRTKYLEKMLGKAELAKAMAQEKFDLSTLVGTNCTVEVVHDASGQYANIGQVGRYFGDNPIEVSKDYMPWKSRPNYKAPPAVSPLAPQPSAEVQAAVAQGEVVREQINGNAAPADTRTLTLAEINKLIDITTASYGTDVDPLEELEAISQETFAKSVTHLTRDQGAQLADAIRRARPKVGAASPLSTAVATKSEEALAAAELSDDNPFENA